MAYLRYKAHALIEINQEDLLDWIIESNYGPKLPNKNELIYDIETYLDFRKCDLEDEGFDDIIIKIIVWGTDWNLKDWIDTSYDSLIVKTIQKNWEVK